MKNLRPRAHNKSGTLCRKNRKSLVHAVLNVHSNLPVLWSSQVPGILKSFHLQFSSPVTEQPSWHLWVISGCIASAIMQT